MSIANAYNVGSLGQVGMSVASDYQALAEAMKLGQQCATQTPNRPSLERELTNLHQSVAVLEGEIDMLLACLVPISESAPPGIGADGQSEILPAHLETARAAIMRIAVMTRKLIEARGRLAL
jgi:hypothetical protein